MGKVGCNLGGRNATRGGGGADWADWGDMQLLKLSVDDNKTILGIQFWKSVVRRGLVMLLKTGLHKMYVTLMKTPYQDFLYIIKYIY